MSRMDDINVIANRFKEELSMQFSVNRILSYVIAGGLLVAAPFANAESQCKTLPQDACSAAPGCAWVDGYVRKDGRQVTAYCRSMPKKKTQSAVSSDKAGKQG